MRIACFNIEKNGASSDMDKQTQVDGFIEASCSERGWNCDIVFLSEIHSAQYQNYVNGIHSRYHNYRAEAFFGGGSNWYVVAVKAFERLQICSQGELLGLHRDLVNVRADNVNGFTGDVFLAHFKSGGGGLTTSQLKSCSSSGLANWVIAGDMNFDLGRLGELNPPGLAYDCWNGMPTHAKGGRLDWVLAHANATVRPVDITGLHSTFNMGGPDHRPIVFDIA